MSQDPFGMSGSGGASSELKEQIEATLPTILFRVPQNDRFLSAHRIERANVMDSFRRILSYPSHHAAAMIGRHGCPMEHIVESIAAGLANGDLTHRSATGEITYLSKTALRMDLADAAWTGEATLYPGDQAAFLRGLFGRVFAKVLEEHAVLIIENAQWLDTDARLRQTALPQFHAAHAQFDTRIPVLFLYWLEDESDTDVHQAVRTDGVLAIVQGQDRIDVPEVTVDATYELLDTIFFAEWFGDSNVKCQFMRDALDCALQLSPFVRVNRAKLLRPYQTISLGRDLAALFSNQATLQYIVTRAINNVEEWFSQLPHDEELKLDDVKSALDEVDSGVQMTDTGRSIVERGHTWAYLIAGQKYHVETGGSETPVTFRRHGHELWQPPTQPGTKPSEIPASRKPPISPKSPTSSKPTTSDSGGSSAPPLAVDETAPDD